MRKYKITTPWGTFQRTESQLIEALGLLEIYVTPENLSTYSECAIWITKLKNLKNDNDKTSSETV